MDGELDVQELHRDLARKHRNVGSKVGTIWRDFTPKQREKAMRESVGDGEVLKYSRDRSLGVLCDYIPEYNLRDTASNPDHFLNIWKFRAEEDLATQLYEGPAGLSGDREMIEKTGNRHAQASDQARMVFLEGEHYGRSFEPGPNAAGEMFPNNPPAQWLIIPSSIGELIFARQQMLFQFLNHIIEEILDLDAEIKAKKKVEKNVNSALVSAVSNLDIQTKPDKSSLPEVCTQAMESRVALEDYLLLLRTEPVVLNQAVNTAFWSRAELVPDDRGRILPLITDRHLSAAFFDSVTTSVKAIAIWDYILRLLQQLPNLVDKVRKGLIL